MRLLAATLWFLLAGQVLAGPRDLWAAALADAQSLPPDEAFQTRYLTDPRGFTNTARNVLAYHANQLSRGVELVRPRLINDHLLAVCLDHYKWDRNVWEKLADTEPYYTLRTEAIVVKDVWYPAGTENGKPYAAGYYPTKVKGKVENVPNPRTVDTQAHAALQLLTGSIVPVVRADWWLVNSCRQVNLRNKEVGIGYYDWLGIKDRDAFLNLARFRQADAEALDRQVRAALDKSGVAQNGRQIAGFDALTGKVFLTLDNDTLDPNNLPTELLKPGAYQHVAEEWFLQAPNGLWYFFLGDANGKRQNTAPDFISGDDSPLHRGRDGRIHTCFSCLSCHVEDGLRPINDWARRTFQGKVRNDIATREEQLEFRKLYLSNLEKQLEEGRRLYREALVELNGPQWTGQRNAEAFTDFFYRYADDPVSVTGLAVELGMTAAELDATLKGARLPASLAPLLQPKGTIRRETVEDFWSVLTLNVLDLSGR